MPLRDKVVALRDIKAEVELGFDPQLALAEAVLGSQALDRRTALRVEVLRGQGLEVEEEDGDLVEVLGEAALAEQRNEIDAIVAAKRRYQARAASELERQFLDADPTPLERAISSESVQ